MSVLDTLADLVSISSEHPPGVTQAICARLSHRMAALGYAVSTHSAAPGLDNLVATLGEGAPHLVFNVHVDTVGVGDPAEWSTEPLTLTRQGDRLYGLGACNAKGAAAVHLALAEALAARGGPRRGRVSFTFVTDEENVGPLGTEFLRRQGLDPDWLVVGLPTRNAVILEERGVMWVALEARGHAAHAGAPEAGDNAISRMVRLLSRLDAELPARLAGRHEGARRATMSVGLIEGGSNTNVVPDRCRVQIDRRLVMAETVDTAFAEIGDILAGAGEPPQSWSMELLRGTNGFSSPADGALAVAMAAAVEAATGAPARFSTPIGAGDGRYFADDGIQILTIGPGDAGDSHCANEWISLAELEQSLAIHLAFLDRVMGGVGHDPSPPAGEGGPRKGTG